MDFDRYTFERDPKNPTQWCIASRRLLSTSPHIHHLRWRPYDPTHATLDPEDLPLVGQPVFGGTPLQTFPTRDNGKYASQWVIRSPLTQKEHRFITKLHGDLDDVTLAIPPRSSKLKTHVWINGKWESHAIDSSLIRDYWFVAPYGAIRPPLDPERAATLDPRA